MAVPPVERELRDLQKALRQRPKASVQAKGQADARDIETVRARPVSLSATEYAIFLSAVEKTLADIRFEHLGRKAEEALWGLVHDCLKNKAADNVSSFATRHAREPKELVYYQPVEYLSVVSRTEVFGIQLLPIDDPRIPPASVAFPLGRPVGCVAAVSVRGTSYAGMADRARSAANHALRVLRVALREHRGINDWQLRFRLAGDYVFSDGAGGGSTGPDSAFELGLNTELVALALSQPVAALRLEPGNDIERKADLSMRWLERARFAGEPLVALLYLFFGLEALLGDTADKLKAPRIAFRQAMLSLRVERGFSHPNHTLLLYDVVRSAAVHGEDVPDVTTDDVRDFQWMVRRSLNDYLTYAKSQGLTRQAHLVNALDADSDRQKLAEWLRARGGKPWEKFLAELDLENPG